MSSQPKAVGFGPTFTATPLSLNDKDAPLVQDNYVQAILGAANGGDATAAYFNMCDSMNKVFAQLQQNGADAWTDDTDTNGNPIHYVSLDDANGQPFYVTMATENITTDQDGNLVTSGQEITVNDQKYKVIGQMTMTVGYSNYTFSKLTRQIGIGAIGTAASSVILPYVWAGMKSFARFLGTKYQTWSAGGSGEAAQDAEVAAEGDSANTVETETLGEGVEVAVEEGVVEAASISLGTVFIGVGLALGVALVVASFILHNTYHRLRIFNVSKYTIQWEYWFQDNEGQITDGPLTWNNGDIDPSPIPGGSVAAAVPGAALHPSVHYADLKVMSSHEFAGIGYVLRITLQDQSSGANVNQFCVYYDMPFSGDNSHNVTFDGQAIQDPYQWYLDAHGDNPSKSAGATSPDGSFAVQSSYDFLDGTHPVPAAGDDSSSDEAYYYQSVLYVSENGLTPSQLPIRDPTSK